MYGACVLANDSVTVDHKDKKLPSIFFNQVMLLQYGYIYMYIIINCS